MDIILIKSLDLSIGLILLSVSYQAGLTNRHGCCI